MHNLCMIYSDDVRENPLSAPGIGWWFGQRSIITDRIMTTQLLRSLPEVLILFFSGEYHSSIFLYEYKRNVCKRFKWSYDWIICTIFHPFWCRNFGKRELYSPLYSLTRVVLRFNVGSTFFWNLLTWNEFRASTLSELRLSICSLPGVLSWIKTNTTCDKWARTEIDIDTHTQK